MSQRRTASGDKGVSTVELALVFPLFAAMVLALIHFGLVEASDSSASNGAREGARVGIFEYLAADVEGSDSRTAIESAVNARLGGLVASPSVAVRCQRPSGAGVTTVPCNSGIVLDRDMIEVTVTWSSVSPFGQGTRTARAQMVIIGRPDLTDIVPPSTTTTTAGPGAASP
jgi:Flp pilus assembly protein TadG